MIGTNGGKHRGRHLFLLDSAATTEEKKKMMIARTIAKRVKTHLDHNVGAYPVTQCWKHTHYGSADVTCEPQKANLMLYVNHKKQTIIA